jgi:hypothetical protein
MLAISVNKTLRRVVRTITPAPARRQVRFVLAKRRIVARYGGIRRSPTQALRYLMFDHELDNFTYEIANSAELSAFIADVLGADAALVTRYIHELAHDGELARALGSSLATRPDRNRSMPFGRRLGWFAIARVRRPRLIVETGVHDGLGSTTLLRAIQRNEAEGYRGGLISIDTNPSAGWLIPGWLRPYHRLVVGNTDVQLSATLGDRPIDMFIHDSDHRYAHETSEFEAIADLASPGAVLLSDNAHASSAFSDFCDRHGLDYQFWGEVPKGHFYPGAGIGVAIVGGTSLESGRRRIVDRNEAERVSADVR